jgi:Domain of unknown function (DUF5916)/Carbohydrate family 9 binding domain-like
MNNFFSGYMKQFFSTFILPAVMVGAVCLQAAGQQRDGETFQKEYRYYVEKTSAPIKIDGDLDETTWIMAPQADSFWLKFPNDAGRPKKRTTVKVTYDDRFVYFGFTSYDSGKAFISSLKRDYGHDGSDGVGIILDPTNQRTNGFFFVVNAFNAQSEDQLPLVEDNAWSWDNKWYSAVKRYDDRWTAEIAIPFKTLRYSKDKLLWGINFLRVDTKANEYSVWTHIPVNFQSHSLAFTGALVWKTPPPAAGGNSVFIPYVTGTLSKDNQYNTALKSSANAGFDAKIALSSSLNLDVTANPDFSQIEVDRQVTNLTRFNIFFPEKRTFFLENSDVLSEYGYDGARPFYSRTIGLDADGNRIPIIGGIRLSGNIDKSTRIGLLNIQTAKKEGVAAQNYTAATVNKRVLKRSVIKGYFLNHENFLSAEEKNKNPLNAYGRNAGAEFNYYNLKGTWEGWAAYHQSFKKTVNGQDNFYNFGGRYNGRNFSGLLHYGVVGTNYYTDMGFVSRLENYDAEKDTVIRLGFKEFYSEFTYRSYPKKGFVNQYNNELTHHVVYNPDNSVNEINTELQSTVEFKNTGFVFLNLSRSEVNLLFPTSFTDAVPLPKGNYTYNKLEVGYSSDFRKMFSFNISTGGGQFYNGTFQSVSGRFNWRKQPHVNVSLGAEYNKLSFPGVYGTAELFLLSPRVEINFSTALFWTTFLQYNTQRNNFNINSRLQYRFRPMSDLFLVYTDNYFTGPLFKNRNRAIVFKLNYWLNL